jgi:predicted DNA-binding transcriptional regulator YafY
MLLLVMSDPSARLLKLLSLLQVPRQWPGSELAARLEVDPRTVRRDVERLRALGYPVKAALGGEGGYRLEAGNALPPLLLDDEEAVAIAVGLRIAAGHAIQGIEEASVRALAKLERVLPSRLRQRVRALGAATVALPSGAGPTVDSEALTAVAAAIAGHERLRFAYQAGDGGLTERLVEPHRLVAAGRRWYLIAFDVDRDDWRTFRLDRLRDVRATGVRRPPRDLPAPDAAAFLTERLYSMVPTYEAAVTLHAPLAEVARRLGHAGELEALDERTCRFRGHADTLEWLAFRLTALGCEFEVHEPPELASHLRAIGGRATRAAGEHA